MNKPMNIKCILGYTGISLCVHLLVCVQNTSFCRSADGDINPFPNKPWFLCVCRISLLKTLWEKEKLLLTSNFSCPTVFSTLLENFLPYSSNLKLVSANSFRLEDSKICHLRKG